MAEDGRQSVLRFEGVSLHFGETPALVDVSFEIHEGATRIILGSAGSGKTTLLKVALGLLRPDSGRVLVFGQDISGLKEAELFDMRARVGVLFQEGGLFDSLTIEENVAYPLLNQRLLRVPPAEAQPRVEEALQFVELEHTLEKLPSELSGGMRRRVGIARAVVTGPPLVLYDSPTAGLDPITAHTIIDLIQSLHKKLRFTGIIVTHELARVFGIVERVALLYEGVIQFMGTPDEIMSSQDAVVQQFISGATQGPIKLY